MSSFIKTVIVIKNSEFLTNYWFRNIMLFRLILLPMFYDTERKYFQLKVL